MTPQEQRKIRLKNDYQQMLNMKGSVLQWTIVKGEAPFVEEYKLVINLKSIISDSQRYREKHEVKVSLPNNYPFSPPMVKMLNPPPYHPNWYRDGKWCYGNWQISESLGDHIYRMMRTIQFDPEVTNPNSPANGNASGWWKSKINKGIFPCDNTVLPDPTKRKINFGQFGTIKKTFKMNTGNSNNGNSKSKKTFRLDS